MTNLVGATFGKVTFGSADFPAIVVSVASPIDVSAVAGTVSLLGESLPQETRDAPPARSATTRTTLRRF
jgi:hypothetical protein